MVIIVNDQKWCAPSSDLEEQVDEQLRHYIGWALDFRMREDSQGIIAAIAERKKLRNQLLATANGSDNFNETAILTPTARLSLRELSEARCAGQEEVDDLHATSRSDIWKIPMVSINAHDFRQDKTVHICQGPIFAFLQKAVQTELRPSHIDWKLWKLKWTDSRESYSNEEEMSQGSARFAEGAPSEGDNTLHLRLLCR